MIYTNYQQHAQLKLQTTDQYCQN